MKISILTNSPNCKAVKQIQNSIINRGHKAPILILDNVKIVISNNEKGFDSIYYTSNNKTSKLSKASIGDAILPRIGSNVPFGAKVIQHIGNMGVFSPISGTGLLNSYDKMKTLQIASNNGIRTPKTIMGDQVRDVKYIVNQLGLPLIVKFIQGSNGSGVAILETMISLKSTLQSFSKLRKPFIIQEFIDAGNRDIRAVVIGHKVVAAYQRTGQGSEFRSNLSLGGIAKSISLNEADKALCIKCAKVLGLNFCGIDLMKNRKGQSFLIEANANFGFKGQEITGVNFGDEMVKYLEMKIGTLGNRKTDLNESRKYVEQLLPQVIGKRIHFIDRSNRKRSLTVRSVQDLESVMYDTFRLNIRN
jgi:ribosomal protein S6--L-glutamate ligase